MGKKMPKGFKIREDSWYIIDATSVTQPKALDERFINKRASERYIKRRFSNDFKHYVPIKGDKLKKFEIEYADIKRRFFSKYSIPDRKILSKQDKQTFRTTMRRKLFGYARVHLYSHKCDRCCESKPLNPMFAKLRDYLFNGRRRRLCYECHAKYKRETKSQNERDLQVVKNNTNL